MQSKYFLAVAVSAQALMSVNHAQATESASSANTIEELVVTAQKREENLQEVPASISAVSAAELVDRGFTTPAQLQFIVPSMMVGKQTGVTSITIRGIGLNQGSPGVAVHVDGVFQPRATMADLTQLDLARLEVLRGPQGTIYGRNATGGVVNYITEAPKDRLEGFTQASYRSYDESRLQGVVNVPFSERVRARLVLDRLEREKGFVRNVAGGPDSDKGITLSGRLRVAAELASNLDLDLGFTAWTKSGPDSAFTILNRPIPGSPSLSALNLPTTIVTGKPREFSANGPLDGSRDYGSASMTLSWSNGPFSIKSITAYQRFAETAIEDFDTTNVGGFQGTRNRLSRTFTDEINVNYAGDRLNATLGAFYMRDHFADRLFVDLPTPVFGLPANSALVNHSPRYQTNSKAVFADGTFSATEKLSLIAGIRFSKDNIRQTQMNRLRIGPANFVVSCPLQAREVSFSSTTPRVGAQYDVSEETHVFATYSKGFKAGGRNIYGCNDTYNPEKVTSYEAGVKNRLFGGSVVVNISAFYYDYRDLQLSQTVGTTTQITNASAAEVKGLEAEGAWRASRHLTLSGNLSLLDATYKRFANRDSVRPALGIQDVSGNRLSNAPKFFANLSAAYRTDPVLAGGRVTARADLSYRSKVNFREFNLPDDTQQAYSVVNVSLIWDSPDEKYRIRAFVDNIANKDYITFLSASDPNGSNIATWGVPRQVGIELRAAF